MADEYDVAENKGRKKLEADYKNSPYKIDYVMTQGKYNSIDSFCTAHTTTGINIFANEVKNRDIPLAKYAKEGLILELWKYNALIDAWELSGYTPYYINYFNDGYRVAWDVRKIENALGRVEDMACTQTTATNYCKGGKIKKVIKIYPEEGRVTRYNNN